MDFIKNNYKGLILSILLAIPSTILGDKFPIIGGPVFAIIIGIILGNLIKNKTPYNDGIRFTSKKILQYAVVLLGFGMNLEVVMETGKQSLPIILVTVCSALIIAYLINRSLKLPRKVAILIGVGSSICGGSAIAATSPIIDADEDEVAQSISVIFLFNILAALIFPTLGALLGFSTTNGEVFGIFAGTAVNDTSSVTAAASTWDALYHLGTQTLDKAVTVKLTRTLAIIPITIVLAFIQAKKSNAKDGAKVSVYKVFPFFILFFIGASIFTTIAIKMGVSVESFYPMKKLSKFFIVMAMAAIGFNTDIVKLIKSGLKPILLGLTCWVGITLLTLLMQYFMHIW